MLAMPHRPRRVVLPLFGQYLEGLRRQAGWKKQTDAARRAKQRGLSTVIQEKLSRLEHGKIGDPDPAFLRDVAQLYQVPFPQLLDVFVTEKYGVPPRPPSEAITTVEGFKPVRWLHAPIAAGRPLAIDPDDDADRWLAFQERWLKPYDRPLCLTVGRDEQSMLPTIQPLDVVLIDQCLERRATPISGGIYAVNLALLTGDAGGTLKRIEISDHHLVIIADNPDKIRYQTRAFDLAELELPRVLIGRVVWIGRNLSDRRRG